MPIPFTVTAVRSKGKLVLFDAGTGAQLAATAGNITKNDGWKKAGIDPAKVDTIVISHFHPDHISGLMAKDTNAPIFPNAKIYVPAAEYKFWTAPTTTAGAAKRIQAVFPTLEEHRAVRGRQGGGAGSEAHQHQWPYTRAHQLRRRAPAIAS